MGQRTNKQNYTYFELDKNWQKNISKFVVYTKLVLNAKFIALTAYIRK